MHSFSAHCGVMFYFVLMYMYTKHIYHLAGSGAVCVKKSIIVDFKAYKLYNYINLTY